MSLRYAERTMTLLMAVLMITSAFIPAVSAIEPANNTPDSAVLFSSLPDSLEIGESATVSVTMQNTGSVPWSEEDMFELGDRGKDAGTAVQFGATRIQLPAGETIEPGENYTFTFTITAPSKPGTYILSYQMTQGNLGWFGEILFREIRIQSSTSMLGTTATRAAVSSRGGATLFVDGSGGADFTTIQEAVNAAGPGDTIIVRDGTYTENVVVNKTLTIRSENGPGHTTIQSFRLQNIFDISADNVTITGFTLSNADDTQSTPVEICGVTNCTISDNILSHNFMGIKLIHTENDSVINNTIEENRYGIWLYNAQNCDIRQNNVTENDYAVYAGNSGSNHLTQNAFLGNTHSFRQDDSHSLDNVWHLAAPIDYYYKGNRYTRTLGNYWDTYRGTDADGDGIGDTPYTVSPGTQDSYPLMHPWNGGQYQKITALYVDDSGGADFTTIQDAVNAASPGDTILVRDGTYAEDVDVNKPLTIRSENGPEDTTLLIYGFNLEDNVTISGFTIAQADDIQSTAINIFNNNNCTISDNILSHNFMGIKLIHTENDNVINNTITANQYGIWLFDAQNCDIRQNDVTENDYAVHVSDPSSNHLTQNNFQGNTQNFHQYDPQSLDDVWHSAAPIEYQYKGNWYTHILGNYWDTYSGADGDGDGIGDTPYTVSSGAQDPCPLMGPWQNGSITSSGESTGITITSPLDDTVASGNLTVAGNVSDSAITSLTLTQNGVQSTVPVQGGNFSTLINLTTPSTITVSGIDSQGKELSATLLLDGDMLPASFEEQIGFDPLDADSDCTSTDENEADNGVIDGYEIFDGQLPVFAKYRIGADPFNNDTDGNGLTDSFELTKLGVMPGESTQSAQVCLMATAGGSVQADSTGITTGDPDGDGLSNLDEQTYGTDPLKADTDDDGLSDAEEVQAGTDPLKADTDDDGLDDGCEQILGTDPLSADSNGNGVLDGDEEYQSQKSFLNDTVAVTVVGRGYAIGNVSVAAVNYTNLISDEVLVSGVYDIAFGRNISSGEVTIKYDPTHVNTTDNISIYRFGTENGTFVPVRSVVDRSSETVSCNATNSSKYAVLNSQKWDALFEEPEVESDMLQASCPAESTDALSGEENIIPAVDDRYPLKTLPEKELVEGVDYGEFAYNETPEWLIEEENESETENFGSTVLAGSEESATASSEDEVRYQAVSNGDFFKGMADWAPSNRVYDDHNGYGCEIDTDDQDYSSPPHSLSIRLWNNGHRKARYEYEVVHANVDLTGVDNLTFAFKCPLFEKGDGLTSSRLVFKIDGRQVFCFNKYSYPYETDWQSQRIDVSGYSGMHTISFNVYLAYGYGASSSNTYSEVQFLIDDVSAWSIQKPADPDKANVRFFVRDSQTNLGVRSAQVYCNNEVKRTDSSGYTNDFFLNSSGVYAYRIEADGYKTHEGLIRVTLGDARTVFSIVNTESAPTGSIRVTSTPNQANIYVDGIFSGGTNSAVSDLLAGSHTVEVTKDGYHSDSRTVQVSNGQTTNVAFDLTAETGTLQVTSSPPGARVFIDGDEYGTTSETTGVLTLPNVRVGNRQVRVVKNNYAPFFATVTIKKDQTTSLSATLNNDDLEGDGIPDYYEEHGYRDGFGNVHTTDPDLLDTDGDGLSDGYEAREMVTENGKTFFKQRSDPTKVDTDGDGLDDYWEDSWGTDPYDPDTDHDGIRDGDDDKPLKPFYIDYISDQIHDQIAVRLGAVFGETGLKGGACYDLIGGDTYSSRPAYVGGWIVSGFAAIGDVRDLLSELSQYDTTGAALTGIGLVPLVGDTEKAGADCVKFIGKYPKAIRPLGEYLAKQGIIDWLGEGRLKFIDDFFPVGEDGVKVGTHLKAEYGLSVDDLVKLMRHDVDLSKVLRAVKCGDGNVFWLEEGDAYTGWIHIKKRHIYGDPKRATIFPSSMTEDDVKDLIFETIQNPRASEISEENRNVLYYHDMVPPNGKYIRVVTDPDGMIITAYMVNKLPVV